MLEAGNPDPEIRISSLRMEKQERYYTSVSEPLLSRTQQLMLARPMQTLQKQLNSPVSG